ncbi:MAG: hypothetical protein A2Y62_08120 [Candidatus Fischerbacteria bacterium RBG_13_37_8]|uniref:Uncharacterized protein n=1 Tax=Candidatus Fischerbacteria bacterium RBG_13_37_8 TaxID=1817863 RepID=A0A1F5VVD8_9BACT|nr:MAG: hypothetical protein A2Y62_08120 [Candidatus Fischerbacteria bacterium RBG_13_37_8]
MNEQQYSILTAKNIHFFQEKTNRKVPSFHPSVGERSLYFNKKIGEDNKMRTLNKFSRNSIHLFLIFVISILAAFMITADAKDIPEKSDNIKFPSHSLLSEMQFADRFNMAYPLKNIPYGSEYSFSNKGWTQFISRYGAGWRLMWDPRTGRPNLIEGKGIPSYSGKGNTLGKDYSELTISYLHDKIIAFILLNNDLLNIDFSSLHLNKEISHIFENGRYSVIQYDYYAGACKEDGNSAKLNVACIPIEGARVFFRFNNGNLIQVGSLEISDMQISTVPEITAHQAEDNVIEAFSRNEMEVNKIFRTELKVVPELPAGTKTYIDYSGKEGDGIIYRLVWAVTFQRGTPDKAYEAWVDARSGKIVYKKGLTDEGHVSGNISMTAGSHVNKVFPYCQVDNNGTKVTKSGVAP